MKKRFLVVFLSVLFFMEGCDLFFKDEDTLSEKDSTSTISSDETIPAVFSCSAGEDQTVTRLGETVTLTGSVSYAPGDSITYTWTASNDNPSYVVLSNGNTPTASFKISIDHVEGEYEFILIASDGTNTTIDSVNISVNYMEKFLSPDGGANDYFGKSVSLSEDGKTVLIGASDSQNKTGSAYIFIHNGIDWVQKAKLTASDKAEEDRFGWSLSLSSDGKTALIGAYQDDDKGSRSGSAYIFQDNGSSWTQKAKLTASDGAADDVFGIKNCLSSDGKTAIIGAYVDDYHTGSAYIFTNNGTTWQQQAKLTAGDAATRADFGSSVSLSSDGNVALIGEALDDTYGMNVGSAYIFTRSGSVWTQRKKLIASDRAVEDMFGYSVSLSSDGKTALIGAFGDDDKGSSSGSAYIFTGSGSSWTQIAKLTAYDGEAYDNFAYDVSLSSDGKTALIGARMDDDKGLSSGSAYIFKDSGSGWIKTDKLVAYDSTGMEGFGGSVSLSYDGRSALISADSDDDLGIRSGSAYLFNFDF